jgi:hypothetical protein
MQFASRFAANQTHNLLVPDGSTSWRAVIARPQNQDVAMGAHDEVWTLKILEARCSAYETTSDSPWSTPPPTPRPDRMVRIAITQAAYEAIRATLPNRSEAESEVAGRGERYVWLKAGRGRSARGDARTGRELFGDHPAAVQRGGHDPHARSRESASSA